MLIHVTKLKLSMVGVRSYIIYFCCKDFLILDETRPMKRIAWTQCINSSLMTFAAPSAVGRRHKRHLRHQRSLSETYRASGFIVTSNVSVWNGSLWDGFICILYSIASNASAFDFRSEKQIQYPQSWTSVAHVTLESSIGWDTQADVSRASVSATLLGEERVHHPGGGEKNESLPGFMRASSSMATGLSKFVRFRFENHLQPVERLAFPAFFSCRLDKQNKIHVLNGSIKNE